MTLHGVLRRETDPVTDLFRFEVPGEPAPKSRARYNGQGPKVRAYTPTSTREAEAAVAWRYRQALGRPAIPDDRSGFGLACTFYVAKRQRRDTDNLLKLVSDALNNVVWADDSQVTEVSGRTVHGSSEPRTVVEVYKTPDLPDHLRQVCEHCGEEFRTYASWTKKFCSGACRSAALAARAERTCRGCGKKYRSHHVQSKAQRWCSRECQQKASTVALTCATCGVGYRKPRSLHRPNNKTYCSVPCARVGQREQRKVGAQGVCDACGGATTKKNYIRCQACKNAGRTARRAVEIT